MKKLIFILLMMSASAFSSDNASNIYAGFSDRVVLIETKLSRAGTGFFLNPELIVTNRHVILFHDQKTNSWDAPSKIKFKNGNQLTSYEAIACSMRVDLCVIKVARQNSIKGEALVASRNVIAGEEAFVIGHPAGIPTPIISTGIISSELLNLPGLNYKNQQVEYRGFTTNAAVSQGSSGSPVLSKNGEILGVAVAIHATAQNLNIIISSQELHTLGQQIREQNGKEVFAVKEGFEKLLENAEKEMKNKESSSVLTATEAPVEKSNFSQESATEIIRDVLKKELYRLQACYNVELKSIPRNEANALAGQVNVQFKIMNDGVVADADLFAKEYITSNLKLCIKNEIAKIKFPKFNVDKYVEVKQVFNLKRI